MKTADRTTRWQNVKSRIDFLVSSDDPADAIGEVALVARTLCEELDHLEDRIEATLGRALEDVEMPDLRRRYQGRSEGGRR